MLIKIGNRAVELLKLLVVFILFSNLVLVSYSNLRELDYRLHVKSGEYIFVNKHIPQKDIFSFTMADKEWDNHEWLYQVFLYLTHKWFGYEGFFIVKATIFSLIFFILVAISWKIDWVFSFPLIFYGLKLSFTRFTLRPDNFSLFFLLLFLIPFIFKKRKFLFILPFIQVIWVNVHGFFLFGPIVLALYLFLNKIHNREFDKNFYNTTKVIFLLTVIACFITPDFSLLKYPFKTLVDTFTGQQAVFYQHILELRRPLSYLSYSYLLVIFVILAGISLLFYKNLNLFYVGLYFIMSIFSLSATRNMYFFVPIVLIIFIDRYPYIKEIFLKYLIREKGFIVLKLLLIIFAVVVSFDLYKENKVRVKKVGYAYIDQDNKIKAKARFFSEGGNISSQMLDFIRHNKLPEHMYNDFNLGGILIFNFFPQRKVFFDGRADFYGPEFFSLVSKAMDGDEEKFEEMLNVYKLDGFIVGYHINIPPKGIKLIHKKGFKCIFFDGTGIIFVKKDYLSNNKSLKKYIVDFNSLHPKKVDPLELKLFVPEFNDLYNIAYVLGLLKYYDRSEEYFREVLRIFPNHSASYYFLANIYYSKQEYDKAFMYCRNSLYFNPSYKEAKLLGARILIKTGQPEYARQIISGLGMDFDKFLKEGKDE